jgi:hypothetical protein
VRCRRSSRKRQIEERFQRARRLADARSATGQREHLELGHLARALDWLDLARPPILHFADWMALMIAARSRESLRATWAGGVARRVCDTCLDLAAENAADRVTLVTFASLVFLDVGEPVEHAFGFGTLARPTPNEAAVHEMVSQRPLDAELFMTRMKRISNETLARREYALAAMLRSAEHQLVSIARGKPLSAK